MARWESRFHRKHLEARSLSSVDSTWWAPAARGWWIAVLFAVGSMLFALGAVPGYATAVGTRWDAGTLFFNLSCGNALRVNLTAEAANQQVWRPDAYGSICFLVASALAWFEVCHGWVAWRPRSWAWWITLVNLAGSVAFRVSAVAGYINPVTGQLTNADRSYLGTLVGAVCFLIGALLLLPERTEELSPTRG